METPVETKPKLPVREGEMSTSSRAVIAIGGAVIIATTFLPWLRAQGGGQGDIYKGTEIFIVIFPVYIAGAAMIVSAFIPQRDLRSILPMIGAGIVAVVCGLVIAAAEIGAAMVPTSFIPEIFRDYVVNIGAGAGLWIALITAALVFVAGSRYNWKQPVRMLLAQTDHMENTRARNLLIAMLVSGLILLWLRYQPWLDGNLAGEPVEVAGWDTPVTGPFTLGAIVLLFIAGALSFTQRIRAATVSAALAGWIFTFLAAAVVISGATWSLLPIDDYTITELADKLQIEVPPGAVGSSKVELGAAWASWASYVFGLITALAAIGVLRYERPKEEVEL